MSETRTIPNYPGMTITVVRNYDGLDWPIDAPPTWLIDRIEKSIPFLNPNKPITILVASDTPGSDLRYGAMVPCNGGYRVKIDRTVRS